jgi:TPR repeat protein
MVQRIAVALAVALCPFSASARVCDVAWDGDKIVASMASTPAVGYVPLRDKAGAITDVSVEQIEAFDEAKTRIAKLASLTPGFVICSGAEPNAFATSTPKGDVIGVTVGMLKLVDGDRDMAAAVIGHEVAHHTKGHLAASQQRSQLIGIAALALGLALAAKGHGSHVPPAAGLDLAVIGGTLVSRKFDRDQEREADSVGFTYVVDGGFNPMGAVRVAERFTQLGGGAGLFFDTHPGWPERAERFRTLIAESPKAQELVARGDTPRTSRSQARQALAAAALEPAEATSDAQKSYVEGMAALKARDLPLGVRELRASAAAGYAPAQVLVGYWHTVGFGGLAKSDAEAVRLYRLAAAQEDAGGQNQLGIMYLGGRGGLSKDEGEALRHFRLAAERGLPAAQGNLGLMYERGMAGLAKDDAEATKWYRLAAEQGSAAAQYRLGLMHETGRGGLEVDIEQAATLYRRAAESRYAPASAALKRLGQ